MKFLVVVSELLYENLVIPVVRSLKTEHRFPHTLIELSDDLLLRQYQEPREQCRESSLILLIEPLRPVFQQSTQILSAQALKLGPHFLDCKTTGRILLPNHYKRVHAASVTPTLDVKATTRTVGRFTNQPQQASPKAPGAFPPDCRTNSMCTTATETSLGTDHAVD
jgi:hypothetical protein